MGIIFRSDIERHGMCKDEPEKECTSFCKKFLIAKCNGMRIIKLEGGSYRDQRRFPFPGYKPMEVK